MQRFIPNAELLMGRRFARAHPHSDLLVILRLIVCQRLDAPSIMQERDFSGTPYVPVYVMLPVSCLPCLCLFTDVDASCIFNERWGAS